MGKKRNRIILIVVEALILIAMVVVLIIIIKSTGNGGVNKIVIDPNEVMVNKNDPEKNKQEDPIGEVNNVVTPAMEGYWNIALFGVDSTEGKLSTGTRTDCIIIASVNQETKDVKLVSVYRDTYLYIAQANSDGTLKDWSSANTYQKCNAAYAFGGAKEALRMLNMNLGLDITDFVTVGFGALTDTIDKLGGIDVDVKKDEIIHLNNYQISIVGTTEDKKNYTANEGTDYIAVKEPGLQTLNGLQATAYCRIRYTGSDFARTQKQRYVIQKIAEKAHDCSVAQLSDIATSVMPEVYTSFSLDDVLSLLGDAKNYKIVDTTAFPFEHKEADISGIGSCVVPTSLETNVKELHKYLFDEDDYKLNDTLINLNNTIKKNTADYLD